MRKSEKENECRTARTSARSTLPSWLPLDGFVLGLIGTVALAALLPVSGRAATVTDGATTVAVAFLFFLYGARLSTREALDGVRHWRLHLTVLVHLRHLPGPGPRRARPGANVLTHRVSHAPLPGGDPVVIQHPADRSGRSPTGDLRQLFSSLLGVVVTPVLAALLLGGSGGGFSADSMVKIGLQLLAPFLAGQLLRRWIGGFILPPPGGAAPGQPRLGAARGLRGVQRGHGPGHLAPGHPGPAGDPPGHRGGPAHGDARASPGTGSRKLGFVREDRITIVFAGSKKSLAAGLPMASVLFGAQASLAVLLPLMLFHQMQLMVCAVLARRYAAVTGAETGAEAARARADRVDDEDSADEAALTRV
ncbi:Bile acid:sodium symporter OS=Streptomyces antimycoticus OX=68175 GN=SANT12839_073110 PE=4 SV=1 [Streptomyces antimycoticus]